MSKIFSVVLILLAGLSSISSAEARGGCGIGFHRGFLNGCYRNEGPPPAVVVTQPVVVAPAAAPAADPAGTVVIIRPGVCPVGYHLGPRGRRCWPN